MANSRKQRSASECNDAVGAVRQTVSQALALIRPDRVFAIAYSGGLDSGVLLDAFVQAAGADRCLALHIHHGLSVHADHWQSHCRAQSAQRGVRFLTANVDLSVYRGIGVEAAARLARYAALRDLAIRHHANVLVLGQHADDQAETVLLQMLRGAGLAGLSAMPARRDIDRDATVGVDAEGRDEVGSDDGVDSAAVDVQIADVEAVLAGPALAASTLPLIRPFLALRRSELEAYAQAQALDWIEDESNQDVRFARNALRCDVLPAIEQHFPAYRQTLSRVARHAASAQTLFDDLAHIDFDRCLQSPGSEPPPAARSECLSRTAIQALSAERVRNMLRFWIRALGMRAASASRMDEMVVQLQGLRRRDVAVRLRHREQSAFGRLSIRHDGLVLHGYRDDVFWSATADAAASDANEADALYAGEPCWQLPAWQGSLRVSTVSTDPLTIGSVDDANVRTKPRMGLLVASKLLANGRLTARKRRGGERLSLGEGRPSRSLKHLFQEAGVPVWQREVPLFYLDDALIFVPYLGGSVRALSKAAEATISGDDALAGADALQEEGGVMLEWLPG